MFVRPTPDGKSKDRLGIMKTTYNLKVIFILSSTTFISLLILQAEPEIESAFYFDLALRTFLAIKSILSNGLWPPNMKYLTCDEYDGTNSPDHSIDLRKEFIEVIETFLRCDISK
jgi:glutamate receptor, ionotropic, invertebrate